MRIRGISRGQDAVGGQDLDGHGQGAEPALTLEVERFKKQ